MRHRIFIDYNLQNFNTRIEVVNYVDKIGLIEGNISLNQNFFLLTLGMYKKPLGELNHGLSSGSLISSANAAPLPKITIENNHPIKLQFKNYILNITGGVSHGLMSDDSYQTNPYLHEKWGYLKIINDQFQFHFGLIHEAIWGGRTKEHGDLPNSLSDFVKVFFVSKGGQTSAINERINTLGNHLGMWDIGFSHLKGDIYIGTYIQHPFEDQSGARWLLNWKDGLYGFIIDDKLKRGLINKLNIEFIYTMNQSGSFEVSDSTYGWDDYYNHYIYLAGWTNNDRSIGTPFATLGTNEARPFKHIENNRIKGFHIAFEGSFNKKVSFKHFSSLTKNYGTYYDNNRLKNLELPYKFDSPLVQYSALIEIFLKDFLNYDKFDLGVRYAFDKGELFRDSSGFEFSIKYNFQ